MTNCTLKNIEFTPLKRKKIISVYLKKPPVPHSPRFHSVKCVRAVAEISWSENLSRSQIKMCTVLTT